MTHNYHMKTKQASCLRGTQSLAEETEDFVDALWRTEGACCMTKSSRCYGSLRREAQPSQILWREACRRRIVWFSWTKSFQEDKLALAMSKGASPAGTAWTSAGDDLKAHTLPLSLSVTESVLHPFETSLRNKNRQFINYDFSREKNGISSHSHLHYFPHSKFRL